MSGDWEKGTSDIYRKLARIAVPDRLAQMAALLTLIPFNADETFRVVELASGEGLLADAICRAFPQAQVLALDYEESMREATKARLGDRGAVAAFDIRRDNWFDKLNRVDLVVSSLCIHHLGDIGKQHLFNSVCSHGSSRCAFLIADLVLPPTPQSNRLFAATWDASARAASVDQTGDEALYGAFVSEKWNLYHHPDPDFDKPSPLFQQLQWLSQAGFSAVDCFWMQAGHAIYGGYSQVTDAGIGYETALSIAQAVLGD